MPDAVPSHQRLQRRIRHLRLLLDFIALDLVTGACGADVLGRSLLASEGESTGTPAAVVQQRRKLMRSSSVNQDLALELEPLQELASVHDAVQSNEQALVDFAPKPRVVQIFYEALCPASARLISDTANGVWASYNARKGDWRIDLVPWGFERRVSSGLQCTHGHAECEGNLMHMCALNVLPVQQAFVLISCLMREPASLLQVGTSSRGSWVYDDWTTGGITDYLSEVANPCWSSISEPTWKAAVEACMINGTMSLNLEQFYHDMTSRANLTQTPTVWINGSFHAQASATTDLRSFLD